MTETNFTEEKAKQDLLHIALNDADKASQGFPKGPMGLTPDAIRATPEFRKADSDFRVAMKNLQNFNTVFVKQFKKEIKANRFARRGY